MNKLFKTQSRYRRIKKTQSEGMLEMKNLSKQKLQT